ncbi:MAG TPA: hypothetical protein VL001_07845 [Candidimonas sp.]|nr:hypothetical protein [Candidimonas sp.]
MNRLVKKVTVVSALAMSCSSVFAAESLNAKVVGVEGQKVALETAGAVPAWVNEGGTVQALGWTTKVVDVDGSKFVVELSKSKASRVAVDSDVVVREVTKQQKFGC